MQLSQAVAENVGGGDQDQHDGERIHTVAQDPPNALPIQSPVNEHADDQAVDNRDCGGLGGGEHAAHHAEHHDQNRGQGPEGDTQLLKQVDQAELVALGVIALYGNDIGADHQAQRQQSAGQISG